MRDKSEIVGFSRLERNVIRSGGRRKRLGPSLGLNVVEARDRLQVQEVCYMRAVIDFRGVYSGELQPTL